MNKSNFWLIRHGETDWNSHKRLQGWRDIELNELGIQQSKDLEKHLMSPKFTASIDVIISSDLKRAYQTAEIATQQWDKPITKLESLRERNYGIYEGHTLVINQGQRAGLPDFDLRDPTAPLQDGEALNVFYKRIKTAFEDIAVKNMGKNIMVFAHGGVIDIAWRLAHHYDLNVFREHAIINASINQFSIDESLNWQNINWGQTQHLDAGSNPSVLP